MDTTYNVTRSKQLRLGIQELLGRNSRARSTCRVESLQLTPPSAASLIRRIL